MRQSLSLTVNGQKIVAQVDSHRTLLEFLRDGLGLIGAKEGCGDGECGACTVIMNGDPVRSCLVLAVEAEGATVETIEGLARGGQLHPIQQAFVDAAAVQCGFCTPGLIMATKALLDRHPQPSEEHIREAVEGHLCRCTGYQAIFQAIRAVVASRENL